MVISTDPDKARRRARMDAIQDRCENAPFASVGGLNKRVSNDLMDVPQYIAPHCHQAYREGYAAACEEMYGEGWRTCSFGWVPVLEISEDAKNPEVQVVTEESPSPYLRQVIACECGFSAIQTRSGSHVFRCDHCGKIRTLGEKK